MIKYLSLFFLFLFPLSLAAQGVDSQTFATILSTIPKPQRPNAIPQPPLIQLHRQLFTTLRDGPPPLFKPPEGSVPKDYQHFLNTVLPAFAQGISPNKERDDPHLLAYFAKGSPYRAALIFTGWPALPPDLGQQLEVTAAYTSDFQYPVGFFAVNGVVINPALQPWDGLVILTADGQLDIRHTDDPRIPDQPLNIEGSYQDYRRFVQGVELARLSVFQSHLLVGIGRNLVTPRPNQPQVRRRVLFRDRQGGIGLYDSLDNNLSLYEVAEILLEKYHAFQAVNLDTGSYNYCAYFKNGTRIRECGALKPKAHLSNILRFSSQ